MACVAVKTSARLLANPWVSLNPFIGAIEDPPVTLVERAVSRQLGAW
jgi:hypothetical protein